MSGPVRRAACRCGQLSATCTGEPVRISVCHCLNCQQRSGSAFAFQARWPVGDVIVEGESKSWVAVGDSGGKATFRFCPECGSTVAFEIDMLLGLVAIPVGAFADPEFPSPHYSVYENRKHRWVDIVGDGIDHHA